MKQSARVAIMKHVFVLIQFICIFILLLTSSVIAVDVGLAIQIASILIGIWSIKSLGDSNWSVYPTPNENSSLSCNGPYKYVRHPMYTTVIFFFLPMVFRDADWFNWMIYGILAITLLFKINYEEKQLVAKHPEYAEYIKVTSKRLVPWVW